MYVKENLPTKFSSPLSESDTKCPHLIFFLIEAWWSILLKNAYASEEADITGGGKKGVMGKKGMMTVMLKGIRSHRKKMRGKMGKGVYFDGCHRNNHELTGIVASECWGYRNSWPSKIKKTPFAESAPSSNPTFSLPSPAFLRDATTKDYNKDPSTSFNQKKILLWGYTCAVISSRSC